MPVLFVRYVSAWKLQVQCQAIIFVLISISMYEAH